jgi:hypothetical protein
MFAHTYLMASKLFNKGELNYVGCIWCDLPRVTTFFMSFWFFMSFFMFIVDVIPYANYFEQGLRYNPLVMTIHGFMFLYVNFI